MNVMDIKDDSAEGGVIASLIFHPEFAFYAEKLEPKHFTNKQNAILFEALRELARRGIEKIDTYMLATTIHGNPKLEDIPINIISDYITIGQNVARNTAEEYMLVADAVLDKAFRREIHIKLQQCERLCETEDTIDIQSKVYKVLDDTMIEYSTVDNVPQYADVVDDMWDKIKLRQSPEYAGSDFAIEAFNEYLTIDPGEFVLFAARAKEGKSMMLLDCSVDLLRNGKSLLYIDSELSTEAFTLRLLSHLTKIQHNRIKWGRYSSEEELLIKQAIEEMKSWKFTHMYLPRLDEKTIYSITKKIKHTRGIDVLVLDYLKSKREGDANTIYNELGRIADLIKNILCGEMGIAGLGAVQLTKSGNVADSSNIERSVSGIIKLVPKTLDEMQNDGKACGNYKAVVICNRNGRQMYENEYIDLTFDGDTISFTQAQQHKVEGPV